MAKITWGALGAKTFESGVSKGVLYPRSGPGVAWNGLISVTERPSGGELTPHYLNGVKYYISSAPEEFEAAIEAYTYPEEFEALTGMASDGLYPGLIYDQQPREFFGLSYRTEVGDDVNGQESSYKIHLVYNAIATPSDRGYQTFSDSPDAISFTWDLATVPTVLSNMSPTAHFIIHVGRSRKGPAAAIEDILYGTDTQNPRQPSISEIVALYQDWAGFQIMPNTLTGMAQIEIKGVDDLTGEFEDGLFKRPSTSRLKQTTTPGLYRLDP